jgi:hypothetical protein
MVQPAQSIIPLTITTGSTLSSPSPERQFTPPLGQSKQRPPPRATLTRPPLSPILALLATHTRPPLSPILALPATHTRPPLSPSLMPQVTLAPLQR